LEKLVGYGSAKITSKTGKMQSQNRKKWGEAESSWKIGKEGRGPGKTKTSKGLTAHKGWDGRWLMAQSPPRGPQKGESQLPRNEGKGRRSQAEAKADSHCNYKGRVLTIQIKAKK